MLFVNILYRFCKINTFVNIMFVMKLCLIFQIQGSVLEKGIAHSSGTRGLPKNYEFISNGVMTVKWDSLC